MTTYNHVLSTCPNCGEVDALEAQCLVENDDPKTFEPEDSGITWADPETTKGAMGQKAYCGSCGHQFQLRMMVIEALRLPLAWFSMEEE